MMHAAIRSGLRTGIVLLCSVLLTLAAGAQSQWQGTWPWPMSEADSAMSGDNVTVQWSPPSYPVKSFGIVDGIVLRWEPRWVQTTTPMDVQVEVSITAVTNDDHGNYDPVSDSIENIPFTFEVGVRGADLYPTGFNAALAKHQSDAKRFVDAHEYTLHIDQILVNRGSGYALENMLPKGLFFDLSMDWSLLGLLDVTQQLTGLTATPIGCLTAVTDDHVEMEFSWQLEPTAMEYDLEWTWVDDYKAASDGTVDPVAIPADQIPYDLQHNATRVTTSGNSYRVPLLYDRGYLIWRVRAVSRDPQYPWIPIQATWSGAPMNGEVDDAGAYAVPVAKHQHHKNWQVTTSFAEEGKRKEVMVYADGTSRARQQVTRNNSLYVPIVGETIYDAVGRPAVQIMPVPKVTGGCDEISTGWAPITYTPDFNMQYVNGGPPDTYRFEDLLPDPNSDCAIIASPLDESTGAAHYYSDEYANAPNPTVPAAPYLPRAERYPLAQTEYTHDNTGRVRSQGGVGITFQLDGHATRQFYGNPAQIQLDRLFGSEAGYAQHFQKNVTIDANGQASVAYIDMFGRTVATALACEAPDSMEAVGSAANLLTTDLFNGLSSTSPLLGQKVGNNLMQYTTQFAVGCDATYTFEYGLVPLLIADPCWADSVTSEDLCARCVYELEMILTDACGAEVWHFPNAGGQAIIGSIDFTNEGAMFDCTPPPPYTASDPDMSAELTPGEYTLTKRLRIHAPARDWYVQRLTTEAYSDCVLSYDDFLDSAMAGVDTMDCYLDCSDCYEALRSLDDYLADGIGTEEDYFAMRAQCDELCRVDSWCDVLYENMRADMSPMGQYGSYVWDGQTGPDPIHAIAFPDQPSVYGTNGGSSILREKFASSSLSWAVLNSSQLFQQPWLELNGQELNQYLDANGTRSTVSVIFNGTVFEPAVVDDQLVVEEQPGVWVTYPENLADVRDFLTVWQSGWERSLLRFHPEYCYYRDCRVYGQPFEFDSTNAAPANTSDAFDGKLTTSESFAQAVASGLLVSPDYDLFLLDPFADATTYPGYAQELQVRFDEYYRIPGTTVWFSMPQAAAVMARCGGVFPSTIVPGDPCLAFGSGTDLEILNTEWAALRGMYRSVKYELQKRRADDYVKTCDCPGLNHCIGKEDWQDWWSLMQTATVNTPWWQQWSSQPINQLCQPCNRYRYTYYSDKVPRVPDPSRLDGLQQSPMELAYQYFLQTGQCPVATAWQQLFLHLAQGDTLGQDVTLDLTDNPAWEAVFVALNDMEPGIVPPAASMTVTSTPSLVTLALSTGCTITMNAPTVGLGDTFTWDAIIAFGQLVADPNTNSFSLYVHYMDGVPKVATITGTMCDDFDLAPCNFPRTCEPNQLARDAQDLFNMMKSGTFFTSASLNINTYTPPGATQTVQQMLGTSILARFDTPNLQWLYNSTDDAIRLRNPGQPGAPALRFDLQQADPASFDFSPAAWSTVAYFANINSEFENQFVIEGYNALDQLVVTLHGQAWWEETGQPDEPVALGICDLAPIADCAADQYQLHEQLAQVIEDIVYGSGITGTSVDLFASPNMSDALAMQLCPELQDDLTTLPLEVLATVTTYSSNYLIEVCNCLTIQVPRSGGVAVGNGLDNANIVMQGGPPEGPHDQLYIPIITTPPQNPAPYVHVQSHCMEFMPCDTCNELQNNEERLGLTEQDMVALKMLESDTIWTTYTSYREAVNDLNDRLDLDANDPGFVSAVTYAEYRRAGYWNSLPAYEEYLLQYKPGIDQEAPLQNLKTFVEWHTNTYNVKWAYERYSNAVEHYNARALTAGKPTILPESDSLFKALLLADLLNGYVDMLFSTNPTNNPPASMSTWSAFDPNDPCVDLYLNDYLPAYWALDSANTDSTGRCPGFEKYVPLASYDEFLSANLCCSDSGLLVLQQYLLLFTDPTAKCPGELPRLLDCDSANTLNVQELLVDERECQRLYLLWYDMVKQYNDPPVPYYVATGIPLEIRYFTYEEFERAGLCACVREYLDYLQKYLDWKDTDPPLPTLLSIEEFCAGEEDPCEDLYRDWLLLVDSFNISTYATATGFTLSISIADFATFERMGLCDCVEAYLAYLQGYLTWDPTVGPWPPPLSIEKYCTQPPAEDCEAIYWDYVARVIALQPVVAQINALYSLHPPLVLYLVSAETFAELDLCYCAEAYLARLELALADVVNVDLEMLQTDHGLWNLVRYCEVPVPCPPLPPPPITPDISIPPGPNDCVQSLLNAAELNADAAYEAYMETLVNDVIQRYDSYCLEAEETFRAQFLDTEHHFTLYYYDQAGNLVRTVPPAGVLLTDIDHPLDSVAVVISEDRANGTHTYFTDHLLVSDHVYNSLGQPIRSGMPDQDGREEWNTDLPLGLPIDLSITGVSFGAGGKGFLTGWLENGTLDRGLVYGTTDGGSTWQRSNGLVGSDLFAAHYPTSTTGFAVGDHGTLLRTTNGGSAWDLMPGTLLTTRPDLRTLYFADANNGLVAGLNGYAARTSDAGLTFNSISLSGAGSLRGAGFDGTNYVIAGTDNTAMHGVLYTSPSLSGTWTPITHMSTTADLGCVTRTLNGDLLAGGEHGVLLHSSSSGSDWSTRRSGNTETIVDLAFVNDQVGVAIVDSAGIRGVLRHTTNGGTTWSQLPNMPFTDLTDLFTYEQSSSIAKAIAVGADGRVLRIILNANGNVGFTNVAGLPATADLRKVWTGFSGTALRCIAVDAAGAMRFSSDLLAGTVTWSSYSISGATVLDALAYCPDANTVNAFCLVQVGADRRRYMAQWILSPASFSSTAIPGNNIATIALRDNGTTASSISSTGALLDFPLAVYPPGAPGVANITGTGPTTIRSIVATGATTWAMTSDDGVLFTASGGTNTANWSDRSAEVKPLPIHGMDKGGTLAVAAQGTLIHQSGGTWHAIPTPTHADLRAVVLSTPTMAVAAGDDGTVIRMNPSTPSSHTAMPVPQANDLKAVALVGTQLYLGAPQGRVWHASNFNTPTYTALNHNSGTIRGLTNNGGTITAVGDQALIHRFGGTTRMVVEDIYTPPLQATWFHDGLTGYVVGNANTLRYTTDGGQRWQVLPLGGTLVNLLGVHGNAAGSALAVGTSSTALALQGTSFLSVATGVPAGTILRGVAVAESGAAIVAGANGVNGHFGRRKADGTWLSAQTVSNQPLGSAWAFPRYMADEPGTDVENSTEDFLLGGNGAYNQLVRYTPYTSAFINNLWTSSGNGLSGDILALWFHDRINGYAVVKNGTGTSHIFRATGPIDHASTFTWDDADVLANNLNSQPAEANTVPAAIAFSDRTQGFVGGSYNGTPVGFARTINDEGKLYSQRFWYDALGRLVLSQNSKQFGMIPKRFSYSLYDELGRVYESGELQDGSAAQAFSALPPTSVNGALLPDVLDPTILKAWVESRPRFEVTRTCYDNVLPGFALADLVQTHLRLRVASTAYYEDEYAQATPDEENYDHATHYSYDIHGNVRTLVQDHPQLGIDAGTPCAGCRDHRYKRIDYSYDLISGNVKQVMYQKDQPDEFNHAYTYDADNRITEVETSADGENWHTDAKYFYYAHGPLQRVELGEHIVQGTDYAYTLQGWLKGVNSERLQPGNDIGHDGDLADVSTDNDLIGRDAFGFALGYYGDNDFAAIANAWTSTPGERAFTPIGVDVPANTLATNHAPLYNGNIAHTVYTLQPFGAGWDIGNTEGQVLAQVYTYDQLNRLKKARGVVGLTNTNTWIGVTDGATNRYRSQYEYDANGNIISANRYDNDGDHYDQFAYKYHKQNGTARLRRNRLYQLYDDADASNLEANESTDGSEDIGYLPETTFDEEVAELNGLHNYHYDALGNLIHDEREQIQAIQWTVAGKVKSVSRTTGSTRKPLTFAYGASGQRILKNVSDPDLDVTGSREHYIRDAQGNIMATYRYTNPGSASLRLNDRPLYGSSRLGTLGEEMELHSLLNWDPADPVVVDAVALNYELTDHLGNVCTVVTGRLLDGNGGGTLKQAELVSAQGYEPFGALLPGRKYDAQRARPVIFLPAVLTAGQNITMTIGGGTPITLVSYTPGWTLAQYLSAICTALGSNGITAVSYPAQNQVRIDNWPSNADLTTGLPIAEIRWDTYRFSFNGQEKDDEVYGSTGTSMTAEFWHYDTRTVRRWNLDPIPQINISDYTALGLSPLMNIDPRGAKKDWFVNEETGDVVHLPGVSDISTYGGEIEGDRENYTKFATDQEMKEAPACWPYGCPRGYPTNSAPTGNDEGNEYTKLYLPRDIVQEKFNEWGVNTRYQLMMLQEYSYDVHIGYDFEGFGRMETSTRLEAKVNNVKYTVAAPLGKWTNTFNEDNPARIASYRPGSFCRVETYKGIYMQQAKRGMEYKLPASIAQSEVGNDSWKGVVTEGLPRLLKYLFK